MDTFTKQPVEVLDFDIDGTDWLSEGDTILTATSTATAGIDILSAAVTNNGGTVKVWVSGGTTGTTYKIETTMTTEDGRVKQHEFRVKVKET